MTRKEMSLEERELLSRMATIRNLERAGQPGYSGTQATSAARDAAWRSWLDKAGGDPTKAKRLRQAAMLRGRLESKKRRKSA